jgi:hypothetical protein
VKEGRERRKAKKINFREHVRRENSSAKPAGN